MTYDEKKTLYERIMSQLSKEVKAKLFSNRNVTAETAAEIPYCEAIDGLTTTVKNITIQRLKNKDVTKEELMTAFDSVYEEAKSKFKSTDNWKELYTYDMYNTLIENRGMLPTSFEILKRKLKRAHKLKDWQFEVISADDFGSDNINVWSYYDLLNPDQKIYSLIISNVRDNVSIIAKELSFHGYELLRIFQPMDLYVPKYDKPMNCALVTFTSSEPKDIRSEISKYKVLYHLSIFSNRENIIKNGIKKSGRNGEQWIFYEPRVFFFVGNQRKNAIEYAQEIAEAYGEDVDLYTVDMKKLPADWTFHYDPLVGKTAVYTEHDIPADAIIKIEEL